MANDTSLGFNLIGRDVSASDALQKVARTAKQTGDDFDVVGKNLGGFSSTVSKGFLGVGAALGGAFAVGNIITNVTDYLRDAATAAIEDEKSVVSLKVAMDNLGVGMQNAGAEDFVKSLMLATGVADDKLRPAFQRLVTATGDVAKSQDLLNLSLDIATATGKDVVDVSQAMAKAANGNIGALTRMGVPLDANIVKSKDFGAAVQVLTDKFGGQASAAADTYGGQLQRIQTAAGEAQETIGYALLDAVQSASEAFGGTGGMVGALQTAGEKAADLVAGIGQAVTTLAEFKTTLDGIQIPLADTGTSLWDVGRSAAESLPFIREQVAVFGWLTQSGNEYRMSQERVNESLAASEALYAGYIASSDSAAVATRGAEMAVEDETQALNDLKHSLDMVSNSLSAQGAMDNYKQALLGLKTAIDGNSKSLDDNNLAGLRNRDVVMQVFSDARSAAIAWGEQNGRTSDEVEARFQQMTANIRQKLVAQGFKPQDIDTFLGGLGLWTVQTQALATGLSQGDAAAAMRMAGQAFANDTSEGFNASMRPGGRAFEAMASRMTALAESMRRETTITVTTVSRSVYESQVPRQARATGGPVTGGQAYWVGEKGPEIFMPGRSGSIVPTNAISSLPSSSSTPIIVNLNVNGSVMAQQDLVTTVRDGLAQGLRRRGLDPSVLGV